MQEKEPCPGKEHMYVVKFHEKVVWELDPDGERRPVTIDDSLYSRCNGDGSCQ